jgi:cytochrome c oxidase subunit 2
MQEFFTKLLGLPVLASEHGQSVDQLIIYVHILMIVLFVGWLGYFGYALFRFHQSRNPKADYFGVRNHASNYIEGAVAIVEGVLLLGVAVPLWARAVDKLPDKSQATVIHVVGQQFNWSALYAGKDGEFGRQDMHLVNSTNLFGLDYTDPLTKDDVAVVALGEMHVPVGKPVICYVSSKDVIHSFKVIAMRITQDAIPGMRLPVWFTPTKEGRYQINCAQLCGNSHSGMATGFLVVENQADFDKWLASKSGAQTSFE